MKKKRKPGGKKRFIGVLGFIGYSLLAGVIYAVALKYFVIPSGVILTGTEGFALATSYYFESEGLFILLYVIFQALLLIFSFIKVGWRFSIKTMLTLGCVVSLLLFLPPLEVASPEPENERLVLVLFGAIIAGVAKAMALKNRGSTGDEDIINVYFSEKLRKPVGKISIAAGAASMTYGLVLNYLKFQDPAAVANTLIYTTIFIFVGAETVNSIYKRYRFTHITINTEDPGGVGKKIKDLFPDRSYTRTTGVGGFASKERSLISLIVTQEELPQILKAVTGTEGNSFIYHHEIDGIKGRFNFSRFR